MKKFAKVLSITLIVVAMMSTLCFATGIAGIDPKVQAPDGEKFTGLTNTVLGVLQWAGIAIAVGMLVFMGIKYMSSGVTEQAQIKKSLPIYILGLVLVVGATFIVGAINSTVNK